MEDFQSVIDALTLSELKQFRDKLDHELHKRISAEQDSIAERQAEVESILASL